MEVDFIGYRNETALSIDKQNETALSIGKIGEIVICTTDLKSEYGQVKFSKKNFIKKGIRILIVKNGDKKYFFEVRRQEHSFSFFPIEDYTWPEVGINEESWANRIVVNFFPENVIALRANFVKATIYKTAFEFINIDKQLYNIARSLGLVPLTEVYENYKDSYWNPGFIPFIERTCRYDEGILEGWQKKTGQDKDKKYYRELMFLDQKGKVSADLNKLNTHHTLQDVDIGDDYTVTCSVPSDSSSVLPVPIDRKQLAGSKAALPSPKT